MNKEQFTNYLQNPENLTEESVDGLTEIVSRFPYCQSAHILLTLNLFKEENVNYNANLKTTAVYAGNRRILKQQIDLLEQRINPLIHPDIVEGTQPEIRNKQSEKITKVPELQESTGEPDAEETQVEKTKQELLDEFIKKQPSISRGRESFFSATDASRRSVVDQENIVSETLAKVYFDQRYFEKAINIYQKLSLKYPEKSIYFAALIEKAKNELKP